MPGLRISGAPGKAAPALPGQWLRGRVDLTRVAAVGHSYGGATAALAASEHAGIKAGVALDPWWWVRRLGVWQGMVHRRTPMANKGAVCGPCAAPCSVSALSPS